MELKVNLNFNEVVKIVMQLPESDRKKLAQKILHTENQLHTEKTRSKTENIKLTDFQKILLNGPTWSEEEYANWKKVRDDLDKLSPNAEWKA